MRHIVVIWTAFALCLGGCAMVTSPTTTDAHAEASTGNLDASDAGVWDGSTDAWVDDHTNGADVTAVDRDANDVPDSNDGTTSVDTPEDLGIERCDTPDFPQPGWDRGRCVCLGARADRPGICRVHYVLGACEIGTCPWLDAGVPTFCVSTDVEARSAMDCQTSTFCQALRALAIRPGADGRTAACVYSDGTMFQSGMIPTAECSMAARGVTCGVGCPRCAAPFPLCWGNSEHNPLGACIAPDVPRAVPCAGASDCVAGWRCLSPNNLDLLGRPSRGVCQVATRCVEVATVAPARFSCL